MGRSRRTETPVISGMLAGPTRSAGVPGASVRRCGISGGSALARSRGRSGPTKSKTLEKYLPVIYFAVAIALVLIVLPSALRPPPQQANQSAELSPDAPPQDNQESIVAQFNR